MDAARTRLTNGDEASKTRTPAVSLLLAYAGVLPIALGAVASCLLPPDAAGVTAGATIIWSGAILTFLSGVRRGLSFRQDGGPTAAQLVVTLASFGLGVGALLSPWRVLALALLLLGYGSLAYLNPAAARQHEAPAYFTRLRPPQMLVAVVALLILLARMFLWP